MKLLLMSFLLMVSCVKSKSVYLVNLRTGSETKVVECYVSHNGLRTVTEDEEEILTLSGDLACLHR